MTTASSSPTSVRSMGDNNSFDKSPSSPHPIATLNSTGALNTETENSAHLPIHETRSLILKLSVLVGKLSSVFLRLMPLDGSPRNDAVHGSPPLEVAAGMGQLLHGLMATADSLSIDLEHAIRKKMELNAKKYPAELCKGKAGKYTDYSRDTGITKHEGQSTLTQSFTTTRSHTIDSDGRLNSCFIDHLPNLTEAIGEFARDRHWSKFHLPRNLLLALMGELGELAELFQWRMDEAQELKPDELDKIGQEIADVSIYLIRLADVCGVRLSEVEVETGLSSLEVSP